MSGLHRGYLITLKYFKCNKLIQTAKALGLSMLNKTSHAWKETENKYVLNENRKETKSQFCYRIINRFFSAKFFTRQAVSIISSPIKTQQPNT